MGVDHTKPCTTKQYNSKSWLRVRSTYTTWQELQMFRSFVVFLPLVVSATSFRVKAPGQLLAYRKRVGEGTLKEHGTGKETTRLVILIWVYNSRQIILKKFGVFQHFRVAVGVRYAEFNFPLPTKYITKGSFVYNLIRCMQSKDNKIGWENIKRLQTDHLLKSDSGGSLHE